MGNDPVMWQRHLAAIDAEGITAKAYAEREGLSVLTLYAWRQRLKRQARPIRHHWSEIREAQAVETAMPDATSCTLTLACGARLEMAGLPAPDWVAALATALAAAGH